MAYTYSIGDITINKEHFQPNLITEHPLAMPDKQAAAAAVNIYQS